MKKFEHNITLHSSNEFEKLSYFCSEQGRCELEEIPSDQLETLRELLNRRGREGWELVQVFFGIFVAGVDLRCNLAYLHGTVLDGPEYSQACRI